VSLLDRADWSTPAAELRSIAPAEAEAVLLTRNPFPEAIDEYQVARLADQLSSGKWEVNGETVVFHADGSLRNGRHRLWACVVAGVPLRTWVIFGT
jgi:hypothetical protein